MMTEIQWLETFGENLYEMILESGSTQEAIADKTNLSQSTISRYIHSQQIPSIKAIINLAYVLDCGIDDLIDFGSMIE